MCGRFVLTLPPRELEAIFGVAGIDDFPPRYNIAPTQPIVVIAPAPARAPGSNQPTRIAMLVRWGFIPGWVKDPAQFPLLINARSETAATKASFRAAMRHRRVLIPASGFYEWKREGKSRAQPYWVRPRAGGAFAFGGLMENWIEPGGSEIDTAAILTTAAIGPIAQIHDRMPVVIRPEDWSRWLDCVTNEPRDVAGCMAPVGPDFFEAIPVSDKVNKVANMGPELLERVESPEQAPTVDEDRGPQSGQLSLL